MQDYRNYELKDFLTDEAFCRWVMHKRAEDNTFWENWIRKNPDRISLISAAKSLISEIRYAQEYLPEEELQQELIRLAEARSAGSESRTDTSPQRSWFGKFVAATVVLAFMAISYHFYAEKRDQADDISDFKTLTEANKAELIEIVNTGTVIKPVQLADGSKVKLSPNSRISYSSHFVTKKREVFLNGEAFFEVTKNPDSPFKVYTRDIVTTVLGTSFTVKAFDKEADVSVVVKTGKVTVSTVPGNNKSHKPDVDELVLLPNQQVVYVRQEQKMKRSLVENPIPLESVAGMDETLIFDQTPVVKIFDTLHRKYGVQIVYDADLLAGCQLTAELGQEPLFEKMSMICKAIQARYEVIDGQIIIYGNSCK